MLSILYSVKKEHWKTSKNETVSISYWQWRVINLGDLGLNKWLELTAEGETPHSVSIKESS